MRLMKPLLGGVVLLGIATFAFVNRASIYAPPASNAAAATPPPAMPVPVFKVIKKTIPVYLEYAARTEATQYLSLQAKVSGYLLAQNATDGSDVKKGDLLYSIDKRDFQAALAQTNAQAQRDAAALDYARANSNRGTELGKTGFLAKDTLEQRVSAVRQGEAALASDKAAIDTAQLNLDHAEIRAPFNGRLGRNQAAIGSLVTVGGSPLNTLVELDRIYVTFNPSESELGEILKYRGSGTLAADIFLPGASAPSHHGELTFIDNAVDRSTGTIAARATIANEAHTLLPGQYVRLRLFVTEKPDALMVPQVAVGSNQLGKYLFAVGKDNKVEQRPVTLGATDEALVVVQKGVAEGDLIVSGNLQKIGPGMPVAPQP